MHTIRTLSLVLLSAALATCAPQSDATPATAFTGATVWDGTGSPSRPGTTILVSDGRVLALVPDGTVPDGVHVVEEVDLTGRYVTPGLVNAHGHVSGLWADDGIEDPTERVRGDLALYAAYGVTTVNSLGDDATVLAVRDAASDHAPHARLLAAGPVIADTEPAAARASASANADAGVDWLKLRVDDNLGTTRKMPWDAVAAVMEVGAERRLPVATHVFYLEDANRLLDMGSSMIAHSVRDTAVDEAFIARLRERGACYVPTLTREVSTFVYADRPDFFDDPFFIPRAHPGQLALASDPDFMRRMAESPAAAGYRIALTWAMENLKTLSDAGIPVAMGTDSGPAARFPGYFEHLELWMMVDAGLTPAQALESATRAAAACIGRNDIGVLSPGGWADFLTFGEDPLEDIRSTASLQQVYISGQPIG
jgi:imidazolonepropionase-like amidohydrolase